MVPTPSKILPIVPIESLSSGSSSRWTSNRDRPIVAYSPTCQKKVVKGSKSHFKIRLRPLSKHQSDLGTMSGPMLSPVSLLCVLCEPSHKGNCKTLRSDLENKMDVGSHSCNFTPHRTAAKQEHRKIGPMDPTGIQRTKGFLKCQICLPSR